MDHTPFEEEEEYCREDVVRLISVLKSAVFGVLWLTSQYNGGPMWMLAITNSLSVMTNITRSFSSQFQDGKC